MTTPPPFPTDPPGDESADPLVDSLLREWLGQDTPPDLTLQVDAIEEAAKKPQGVSARFSDQEMLEATARAWEEVCTASRRASDTSPNRQHTPYTPWISLAIAASLVGILAVTPLWRSKETRKPIASQPGFREFPPVGSGPDSLFPKGNTPKGNTLSAAPSDRPPTPNSGQVAQSEPSVPRTEPVLAETQPSVSERRVVEPAIAQTTPPRLPEVALEDPEIASVIEQQLAYMWARLQIAPGKVADLNTVEDRLATVLIGRLPTDAEREWARKSSSGGNVRNAAQALARRWIDSEEFDRHWAGALSDYYLDRSLAVDNKDALVRFQEWLMASIQTHRSIGTLERDLIRSDIRGTDPQSYWLQRWMTLGTQGQGSLLAARGDSPAGRPKNELAALELLALQGLRLSSPTGWAFEPSQSSSERYDRLVGIAAAFVSVFPSKDTELYVSDSQGRVVRVPPTFPDGSPMASGGQTRDALGQWFENHAPARQPLVDFVWSRLFGQPLVPSLGLAEREGLEERRDLLEFLGNQSQSQQASLKKMVLWVALASPMYVESIQVDAQDYLQRDSASLANLQHQVRLFARYSARSDAKTGAVAIASLSPWVVPQPSDGAPTVLAQPTNGKGSIDPASPAGSSNRLLAWSSDRIRFEMSNMQPYQRIGEFAAVLASGSDEWDAAVDRAYVACLLRHPTETERSQARELLSWSDGDRRTASVRLLNALLGHL